MGLTNKNAPGSCLITGFILNLAEKDQLRRLIDREALSVYSKFCSTFEDFVKWTLTKQCLFWISPEMIFEMLHQLNHFPTSKDATSKTLNN